MSDSARKKQRTTTRNSEAPENLRQLAGVIPKPSTPFRRASSAGLTPGSRRTPTVTIRTPGTAARTPRGGPGGRPAAARRTALTTPHAIRALRERSARTPGHVRRRSGRIQRETPRDALRQLSRVLKPNPRQIRVSPEPTPRNAALDLPDVEDGPDLVAPRLSMPLGDMYDDDDSFHEAPPRQSLLPDIPDDADTGTMHSLEFGRRALSEDPRRMFTSRVSERFADLNELGVDGDEFEIDGTFINRRATVDVEQLFDDAVDDALDDTTTEIRALTGRRDGHASDINLGVFGESDEPDEPTFRFVIPPRIQPQPQEQAPPDEEESAEEQHEDETMNRDVEMDDQPELEASDEDAPGGLELEGWESDHEEGGDADLQAYRGEVSAVDRSLLQQIPEPQTGPKKRAGRRRKEIQENKFGHLYPSFPEATVKRLATSFAKSQGTKAKISKDTLAALMQATDWYFQQVGEDLAAYSQHGGRRIIEERDVVTLMKRYV
ncbi:centromere kinetochore component CENP-T-domain-containing protein [Clohesyomyces aquaticus]|uniref:Centromere kinetochore component CENP-T-domain-containing protein n=1 Tax=Clohesyomyces aquaticus TaxID=1231657 RepID=A0A1Y1Y2Q9_9PLEO|nr:centromere kinetochore component CENP-T-domain-containing protein [Clohesyomyces aquaticus]